MISLYYIIKVYFKLFAKTNIYDEALQHRLIIDSCYLHTELT